MDLSASKKILGYGICGPKEKYLKQTLDCFKKLCDHAVILCNNTDAQSVAIITSYGFDIKIDNREWGLNQHRIKQDFVSSLEEYNPEWLVCLDMDEVLDISRLELEDIMGKVDSIYVYIVNLWNEGWKRRWSFWNIRAWKWNGTTKFVNRPLHCGLAAEWAYYYGSYCPIVLYHYGLKDKEDRDRKIARYEKYDPEAIYRDRSYYEGLKDNTCEQLDIDFVKSAILKETNLKRKQIMEQKKKRYVYIKTPAGLIYDIPESQMEETLKRKGFTFIGYEDDTRKKIEELFKDEPEKK